MASSSTTHISTILSTTEQSPAHAGGSAATDTTAVLALRDVAKRYRGRSVLEGLDLTLARGEIVGLLGPNGSGKTTTLRIAAGLLWPDRGDVSIAGEPLAPDRPASRARIGYLPERVPLYDALSVRAYLDFVAGARGLAPPLRRAAVAEVVDAFALGDVTRRTIGRLSKGFRQRVGLAQALLGAPELLLLDEPTNGLDPFQILEARSMIRRAGAGRAVIFSTHVLQEVAALCTRVVYLHHGRLLTLALPTAGAVVMQAVLACATPAPVLAALQALDPALGIAAPRALGAARWALDIDLATGRVSRGELARALVEVAALESFAPRAFDLESALSAALAAASDGRTAGDAA